MQLTRRNLFKLGTLTGAAGALPPWLQTRLPAPFHTEVELPPAIGEEHWVPTACRQCSAGCGLLARVIVYGPGAPGIDAGRAVGIKGDPQHPISQGALCPKGAASLQELYHPDRIRQPLQRAGNRGEGKWQPISWDAALEQLAHHLTTLRQSSPAHLGILLGPTPGMIGMLWHRFAGAFGTPYLYEIKAAQDELPEDAAATMMGAHDGITVDLSRAEFVLSFCDWLQCFPSPVEASRAYGLLRRRRPDRRVRIIAAAPRLSVTAAKADEWIPVYPGTEGVLALALAHVLLREKLWDEGFVRQRTQGFEEFKSLVLQDYAPDQVANITGVPAETVEHLAKEFAANKPAVALCDRTDLLTQMAVLALNALAGNIGRAGGVRPKPSLSPVSPPAGASGSPSAARAPEPKPADLSFEALLLHHANPLFVQPQRWRTVLEKTPFVACISSFLDDTAQYADLILPDHTPLEALGDVPAHTLGSGLVFSISNPVVKPLYDTRPAGDLLLDLAHRIGGPVAAALPEESYDEVVKQAVKPLFESQHGSLLRKVELAEESWITVSKPTLDLWFKKLTAAGGWADLSAEGKSSAPGFRTPSGKFEFRSDVIRGLKSPSLPVRPDYPLRLCVFTPLVFAGGVGAHLPYLQGIAAGRLNERRWETWVEINPVTASTLGVSDDDWVMLESTVGRIRAHVKLFEGALPDVVSIPFGLGHTAYGRWAAGIGANPAELLETEATTGEPLWQQTRVRVTKAGE